MTTRTTFVGAGTITVMPDVVPGASPMPAVDGSNADTQLTATGAPVWVAFGTGAQVGSSTPGSILVTPGAPILLTGNAATLAACSTNSKVLGGAPAAAAAASTSFASVTQQRGGSLTVTRGTASPVNTY